VVRGSVQRFRGRFPSIVTDYISLSQRSAELLTPYLPPDARLYPLQNVVDVAVDPPVEAERNRTIVCVGRLDPEKACCCWPTRRAASACRSPSSATGRCARRSSGFPVSP